MLFPLKNILTAIVPTTCSSFIALSNTGTVEIKVTGLKINKDQVVIKVYRGKERFPRDANKAYKIFSRPIEDQSGAA